MRIGFIGTGAMASAIARGAVAAGFSGSDLMLADRHRQAVEAVSYTHLDVYKRQRSRRPPMIAIMRAALIIMPIEGLHTTVVTMVSGRIAPPCAARD